jgi:hypothetical protein
MTISVSARAAVLGVPAAWPDIEAGTVASISGFGRTGDRQAFMAAAGAMRAGMDHRIAIERDAAFTQAAKAALSAVGLAYGRVVESLQAGTRDESRYATLAQDLADIRDRLGSLPDGLAGPIADAVTAGLCHGAGTREYNGFTMRADGRLLLPGEADAGDACAAWLHAAAAAAPGQDAERLLAAAGQISAAASRARAAGEPGTALRR